MKSTAGRQQQEKQQDTSTSIARILQTKKAFMQASILAKPLTIMGGRKLAGKYAAYFQIFTLRLRLPPHN